MFFDRLEATVKQSIVQRDKDRTTFLRNFLNLVEKYEYLILFQHVNPDGDCLGAVFGFQELIRENFPHKKVYIVGESNGMYPWMPMRFDNFINYSFDFSNALAVVMDVGQSTRIQKFNKFFKNSQIKFGDVVRIDHHNSPCDFSVDLTWDDPTYAATCCQIVQIADFYGWRVTPKAATFLYLGICTDSIRFSTESSLPRTLILAAKTWRYGADYVNVNERLSRRTWDDIRIRNYLLDKCNRTEHIIWYFLTLEEIGKLGIVKTKGLISTFHNIEEHWIWILFIETEEGKVKVDFRSKNVPVRDIAIKFGGGGHEFAAGAVVNREDIEKIVELANATVEEGKKNYEFREVLEIEDLASLAREKKAQEALKETAALLEQAKEVVGDARERGAEDD